MMKRRLGIWICLFMLFAFFSACIHTRDKGAGQMAAPSLARIIQKGELLIGTSGSMPPFTMTTKKGDIIGLDADIARYLANGMGVKLRLETIPFSELIESLEQGKLDMILSNMTITQHRNLKVAFVGPYATSGKAFLTKIETIATAKDPSVLNSPERTFAALKGSTSQAFAEQFLPRAKLLLTDDHEGAVELVIKDRADAMLADWAMCQVALLRNPDEGLLLLFTRLTYEPIGIGIPANDPHLINWVENSLKLMKGSGYLKALERRWFGDGSWLLLLP